MLTFFLKVKSRGIEFDKTFSICIIMTCYISHLIRYIPILLLLIIVTGLSSDLIAQGQPSLRLLYPNGNETLAGGTLTKIIWSSETYSTENRFRIEYSTDGGARWELIEEVQRDTTYSWTVPLIASSSCLVRVTQVRGTVGNGDQPQRS